MRHARSRSLSSSLAAAAVLCWALACGDTSSAPVDAVDGDVSTDAAPDTDAADTAAVDTGEPLGEFLSFAARYDLLETLAGTGTIGDKGVSGWSAAMEGGLAVAAELSRPHIALADAEGQVYIADKDAHAVRRVGLTGTIETVAGTGELGDDGDTPGPGAQRRLSSPNGLWLGADGTCYILDLGNGKVRRLGTDGVMTTLFTVPGGIAVGRGVWVADDESLAYVSSGDRVLRWSPDEGVTTYASGFSSLGNLVVDASGSLIVTDRLAHRVLRVAEGGATTPLAGNGTADDLAGGGNGGDALQTGLDEVRGVWPVDTGGLLVCTHKGDQVWYITRDGVAHVLVDGDNDAHAGDGMFYRSPGAKISEPRAVSITPSGDILITEHDAGFVRIVRRVSTE